MFDSPVLDKGKSFFVKKIYSEYEGKRFLECLKINQLMPSPGTLTPVLYRMHQCIVLYHNIHMHLEVYHITVAAFLLSTFM